MEASALTSASHDGLLARRSPLLRLQGDERLVALIREGHDRAFEVLFDRYQARLLSFCRHLLGSRQDAEDVLQDVFVAAHTAMLADERPINARPWLYRISRNRCLNHLRRPVADGQDSMDVHPHANGTSTFERVQRREELRTVVADVQELPETQRAALILREIDGLAYTEIAQAMGTSLPAVKSLLVRARMSLAEASESRILACEDVRLELAEAAEGLAKVTGPARRHVRDCSRCRRYRGQLRSTSRALGALAPFGLFAAVGKLIGSKFGGGAAHGSASSLGGTAGGAGGTGGAAGGGAGAAGAGAGAAGSVGGAAGSVGVAGSVGGAAAAAGGSGIGIGGALGAVGGVVGAKAAVGVATAALITAGAVGAHDLGSKPQSATPPIPPAIAHVVTATPQDQPSDSGPISNPAPVPTTTTPTPTPIVTPTTPPPVDATTTIPTPAVDPPTDVVPPVDPAVTTPPPADQGTGTAVDDTGGTDTTGGTTDGTSGDAGGSSTGDGTTTDPDPPPPYVPPPDGTVPAPDPSTLPVGDVPPPASGSEDDSIVPYPSS